MILSAFRIDDPRSVLSQAIPNKEVKELEGIDALALVQMDHTSIHYHSDLHHEYPGRPYLHLRGNCIGLMGKFDYDVNKLEFPAGKGISVDCYYEFTDEQIADLALKGLFNRGFKCPDILKQDVLEIPVKTKMIMVEPNYGLPPIIFADIELANDIEIDMESSGYDFAAYFEKLEPKHEQTYDDIVEEYISDEEYEIEDLGNEFNDFNKQLEDDLNKVEQISLDESQEELKEPYVGFYEDYNKLEEEFTEARKENVPINDHDSKVVNEEVKTEFEDYDLDDIFVDNSSDSDNFEL